MKRFFIVSIVFSVLAFPVGFFGWLSDRTENSPAEIAQAEHCLDDVKVIVDTYSLIVELRKPDKPKPRLPLSPENQALLTDCLKTLTYRNKDIGKSRFVAQTGVLGVDTIYPLGIDPDWAVKEWSASYTEASGVALASAAGTLPSRWWV